MKDSIGDTHRSGQSQTKRIASMKVAAVIVLIGTAPFFAYGLGWYIRSYASRARQNISVPPLPQCISPDAPAPRADLPEEWLAKYRQLKPCLAAGQQYEIRLYPCGSIRWQEQNPGQCQHSFVQYLSGPRASRAERPQFGAGATVEVLEVSQHWVKVKRVRWGLPSEWVPHKQNLPVWIECKFLAGSSCELSDL